MDGQWEATDSNLLVIIVLIAPLHKIRRKGLPPWSSSGVTRVRERKHGAFMRYKETQAYENFVRYTYCRTVFEKRIAGIAKRPSQLHVV